MPWRTIQTQHFRVHAYDGELAVGYRAAALAEQAYAQLSARFGWIPGGRIDLTVVDQADAPSARSSAKPRNYVIATAAPPETLSTLNDHDDWLAVLIVHELTHVFHLDVVLGLPRVVNAVLGKALLPNALQPNWMTEGLAVVQESALTPGGRARSSLFDMYLRVAALEGRLMPMDAASNGPLAFPYGATAYAYGASFVQYLHDRFGVAGLAQLAHRFGRDLFPFGINRAARATFGVAHDRLWQDWRGAIERRARLAADAVERQPVTPGRRLTFHGEGSAGGLAPRFLPDGRLIYQRATSVERTAFVSLDVNTGQAQRVLPSTGAGWAAPLPDGRGFVYQQVGFVRLPRQILGSAHAQWNDLWLHDLTTGRTRALTHGLRLQEPDVSPDGSSVAAAIAEAGARHLAVWAMDGKTPPRIVGARGRWDVAASPAWSPDGAVIVYVLSRPGSGRELRVHDVRSGTERTLTTDAAIEATPRFSPDGRWVLFSSDRTGIYNVYAHELATGTTFQVTNVVGGAFAPVVSPDGRTLVFVGFTAAGFDLYATPYDPHTLRRAPPSLSTRDEPPAGERVAVAADVGLTIPPEVQRIGPYQGWRHLLPRVWDLSLASDPLGLGPTVAVATTVEDPARVHSADLRVDVPFTEGDASARGAYTYHRWWPDLSVTLARAALRSGGLVVDGRDRDFRQHAVSAAGQIAMPVMRRPDASATVDLGYVWTDFWSADPLPAPDPQLGITRPAPTGPLASAYARASYTNAKVWRWSVSPQEGRNLSLSIQHGEPRLGSKLRSTTASWEWTEYWTLPWAKLQVLALSYRGGISTGQRRDAFELGGFAQQDVARALFLNRPQCCQFLRGYAPTSLVGSRFHAATAEFRTPLLWIERGYQTFPVYLRRLHGAAFVDVGDAFDGDFHARNLRWGAGGELRLTLKLAYEIDSQLFLGVARGLSVGGVTQAYLVSSFPF